MEQKPKNRGSSKCRVEIMKKIKFKNNSQNEIKVKQKVQNY